MSGGNTCIAEPNLEDNSVKDQFSLFFFGEKFWKIMYGVMTLYSAVNSEQIVL